MKALRTAYLKALQTEDFTRFKFVDETSTNLTYRLRYARAERGRRPPQAPAPAQSAERDAGGRLDPERVASGHDREGTVNGNVVAAYLPQVLGLALVPGDVVVLGNLPAHKVAGLAGLVETRGVRLLYLPPCLPYFNPIELAFSKLKTWLRTAQGRTRDALEAVIQTATEWVSGADAKNWFDHCGYHVH